MFFEDATRGKELGILSRVKQGVQECKLKSKNLRDVLIFETCALNSKVNSSEDVFGRVPFHRAHFFFLTF